MLNQIGSILQHVEYLESQVYLNNDLGMTYHEGTYTFKVWSPSADEVSLNLYRTGDINDDSLIDKYQLTLENNVWVGYFNDDLDGLFYTYEFNHQGEMKEAVDLYAKAVGINGDRTAIIHLDETNPEGWETDQYVMQKNITDAMIWELHVEDFTADPNSGVSPENQGKYLGFTEENTTLRNEGQFPTGLNYLTELGVNYVHLLPIYDFENDEMDESYYNWGYDPKNYMAPEGKYSSDPNNPKTRIKELKQLIQSLHKKNIGVVMDVVYNHTYHTEISWFQYTVPYYYYRFDDHGNFSNGSGVGNETASERKMMRKYMIDSLIYWAEEYHIDGFRFDLMGVHDSETMNAIRNALDERGYEDIIIYGEPWSGGELALKHPYTPADRNHVHDYSKRIALFNAEFRDAIKGHVFLDYDAAFLQGANNDHSSNFKNLDLIAPIMGNTQNDAGEYHIPEYKSWARVPTEVINYSSAHDNLTLYDKLVLSTGSEINYGRQEHLIAMNKINAAILFTSQGGVFIHAGEEFARTKSGNENSYNASIDVNKIDWARTEENKDLVDYYRGMMAIRKEYAPLRDATTRTAEMMYFRHLPENILFYTIPNMYEGVSKWKNMVVAVNTAHYPITLELPKDENDQTQTWTMLANHLEATADGIEEYSNAEITLQPRDVFVFALER